MKALVVLGLGLGLGLGCKSPKVQGSPDSAAPPDLASPAPLAQLGRVRGRVLHEGQPEAGVRLRFGTAGRVRSAETDAQGGFELTDVPPGAYVLSASLPAKGLGAMVPVDVGLEAEPEAADAGLAPSRSQVTELRVELQPTTRMTGSVRDDLGRPLAGAFVRLEEEDRPLPVELETKADGAFAFDERLRGAAYRLTVRRAGYVPEGPRLVRAAGSPVEVRLRRGAVLVGSVVDERGAPVVGAELAVVGDDGGALVSASGEGRGADGPDGWARLEAQGELGVLRGPVPYPPAPSTLAPVPARPVGASRLPRTDAKGQFRIAELVPGRVVVTARHPEYAAAASLPLVLSAGSTHTVQITLLRGVTLHGRVLDEHGGPIADGEITSSDGRTVISDAGGRFVLDHLVSAVRLQARKTGFLKAEAEVAVPAGAGEVSADLTLRRAVGRLGGQIVDGRGDAMEGARVSVTPHGGEPARATSDRSGRFLVEGLPDGPYRVEVEQRGWPRLRIAAMEPTADARLVLEPGGGIEGELLDPRTGSPPADVRFDLVTDGERISISLEGRRFRAVGLPAGPARLVARARGYPRLERSIEILSAERPGEVTVRDLRLEMELGGQIRGRVREDRGGPAAGAEVELVGSAAVEPVRTDSDGTFVLVGVPSGRAQVRAQKSGATIADEVEVRANEESRVDLTLPPAR